MEVDRYKGGVVFKWINKNEVYAKYNGKGRPQNLQAHIDKLHTDYIATRSGVDTGFEIHGLFGNILDTDEVEMLELDTIKKHIQGISKKNIDVFKTVISLKNEDAMEYGYFNKKAWKEMLDTRMPEIARAFKISLNDLEWVAAFHAKKNKPHCHLIVWNKNQARSEMLKKIGNQILKSIKETKTEEYQRKSAEWKEKREYWNFKHKEFEEKQAEFEARQELYEKQLRESNIRHLIQETYTLLSEENISKLQSLKRTTRTFGDLSKREIKEIIRNNRSSGFDWFGER